MLQQVLGVFAPALQCTTCAGRDKKLPVSLLRARSKLPSQHQPGGGARPCGRFSSSPSVSLCGEDFYPNEASSELPYLQSYDHGWVEDGMDSDRTPHVEITGASHKSLKQCAQKLQHFALKTRVSLQHEDDHEATDEMFDALRSAESACDVVLNGSASASMSTVAMSKSLVTGHMASQPSMWRKFHGVDSSEGDDSHAYGVHSYSVKSECVMREYERRDVPAMIQDLRVQMHDEGILQESELSTDSARLAEVHAFQEAMCSKFEALGVHSARKRHLRTTAKPTEAVRDAVAAYHAHCKKIGRFYAMPGDPPENHGLHTKDWNKLTHYTQVLNSQSVAHYSKVLN